MNKTVLAALLSGWSLGLHCKRSKDNSNMVSTSIELVVKDIKTVLKDFELYEV